MITINVQTALVGILLLALIILVIFLILLARKLMVTVDNINRITSDAGEVSQILASRSTEVNDVVGDLGSALNGISSAMQGNQNLVGAITNLGKAVASMANYVKANRSKED